MKFPYVINEDGEIIITDEIGENDNELFFCPECKQARLSYVKGFYRGNEFIESFFRTYPNDKHNNGCYLTQTKVLPRVDKDTIRLRFPILERKESTRKSVKRVREDEPKSNKFSVSSLRGIVMFLSDKKIKYAMINGERISRDEFIKRYIITFLNEKNLYSTGKKLLVATVRTNQPINNDYTNIHLSKLFDTPRVRVTYKKNIKPKDRILVYMDKKYEGIKEDHFPRYILLDDMKSRAIVIENNLWLDLMDT